MHETTYNERFGALRSIAASVPSAEAWSTLCATLDAMRRDDPERVIEECVPYLDAALARWPDHLRAIPEVWVRDMSQGGEAPTTLPICRALRWPHTLADDDITRLFDAHEHLAHLTHLGLATEAWDETRPGYTCPLESFMIWGDEALGSGRWLPTLNTLEVFGGWALSWGYAHNPNMESIQGAEITELLTQRHGTIHTLCLSGAAEQAEWALDELCTFLTAGATTPLLATETRQHVRICNSKLTVSDATDAHTLRLPGDPEELLHDAITLRYDAAWGELWVPPDEGDEMRPGWRKNLRVEATPQQLRAHRALQAVVHALHTTFGARTISFEGACALAHPDGVGELGFDRYSLFLNDGWQDYAQRWE